MSYGGPRVALDRQADDISHMNNDHLQFSILMLYHNLVDEHYIEAIKKPETHHFFYALR